MSLLYSRIAESRRDADADAYILLVQAAGGTVTAAQRDRINDWFRGEKIAARWDSIKRFYLPIWGVAAANAICLRSRISGTFVGGVTHSAGYVQGNGTSGSLLLDANLPTMGVGHTNIAMGGLCYIAPTLFTRNLFSSFGNVSEMIDLLHTSAVLINSRIGSFFAAGNASLVPANAAAHRGVIIGSYNGTSRFIKILRSSGITTGTGLAAATGATPTLTPRFMADSRNASGWSDAGYGAFYVSTGMTTSNADLFITAVETLWEGTTGLTLP